MKHDIIKSSIQYHNKLQLEYFDKRIKKTMVPVNTYYIKKHIQELLNKSGIQQNHEILEVGCGMGKFTFQLLNRGYKVTGLDLSPFLLQKLLEYNNNKFNLELHACDILDAPDSLYEKFDYVIGFFTLHHFQKLHIYFKSMSRLIKPGGKIVFIEPNPFNLLYYFQILMTPGMKWRAEKGILNMRKKVFEEAASYSGLTNLEISKFGLFPPHIANTFIGRSIEEFAEKIDYLKSVLPFQLLRVEKPALLDES